MANKPTICLNMIVRNESHIIHELFDIIIPHISTWVIVDTGSDDGTQDVIRNYMDRVGIPGELHERPWKNFGHNRSEALVLAQGHADYIWVIDADDLLIGTADFDGLDADVYNLRYANEGGGFEYWRPQIFRDGLPWRYEGVVHEFARLDFACQERRLQGDYHVLSRRLGNRNADYVTKYERDRDLLLAEMEQKPDDSRSAFYLAQSYFDLGDFPNAALWYARRAEMGGWDEEVFMAKRRVGDSMRAKNDPWPDVQEAYLQAWAFRPTRSEPLYLIAHNYRMAGRFRLGYLFAERAAKIPLPEEDMLFVLGQVYYWFSLETQAACGEQLGKQPESFAIYRQLVSRANVPEEERQRFAAARDLLAPLMIAAASSYPSKIAEDLANTERQAATDTVSVVIRANHNREATERTLNSLLHCCTDISQVNRFLIIGETLCDADRTVLLEKYPFLEFAAEDSTGTRFTLNLDSGWRFFAPEPLISRLTAVFHAEPDVAHVAINYADSPTLLNAVAPLPEIRKTPADQRYVLIDRVPNGPAMVDGARVHLAHGQSATLDEVLCIAGG